MLKFFNKNTDRNYKMLRSNNSALCLNCKRLKQQEKVIKEQEGMIKEQKRIIKQ
jgi:hypothetical protein